MTEDSDEDSLVFLNKLRKLFISYWSFTYQKGFNIKLLPIAFGIEIVSSPEIVNKLMFRGTANL